jgi:23S rRNA (pseudouridine1915-N3)-methyltransferase
MKLLIAGIGRLKAGPERDLFQHYADRLNAAGRGVGIGPLEFIELPEARGGSKAQRTLDEAARLIARAGDSHRIVLDETGKGLSSRAFAQALQVARDGGIRRVAFLLGGADGHGHAARDCADLLLSLGPMTLPHGLARIVLAEQIYRAITLIAGHPYHRD